jgi:hypothetical protein
LRTATDRRVYRKDLKTKVAWAGAVDDSVPAQIIDLNDVMIQSDVSCNFVGLERFVGSAPTVQKITILVLL